MSEGETLLSFSIKLTAVFLLVFANGFFVAAEFSLVGMRRSRILALIEEGDSRALTLLRVASTLDAYLSACQFGITLASLGLGWLGESTFADVLTPFFEKVIPTGYAVGIAHSVAIFLAFSFITFLHIVLGELAPKTLALERTEKMALVVAKPMELFYKFFKIPIQLLNYSGNLVLRIFKVKATAEHVSSYTKDELRQLVEMSHQSGHLQSEELQMLHNIIEFSDTEVREVMVPRTKVSAVSEKATFEEVDALFSETGFSRIPVYRDSLDNIIGTLFLKDIVSYLRSPEKFSIQKLITKVIYLPEKAHLGEALRQMRRARVHIGIVVDEHGATLGIVTLENVLEQIVGQIQDENDEDEKALLIKTHPGVYTIDGGATIKLLNKELKLDLPEEDSYTTLAGFLMAQSGEVLKAGAQVKFGSLLFTVTKAERFRILEVKLETSEAMQTVES
ncbi:MAG: HlyC/CorC family transporter [Blastocatellia bacterium]|nr:HlyC/CorC family transporter [Blastocatellia bacterium]